MKRSTKMLWRFSVLGVAVLALACGGGGGGGGEETVAASSAQVGQALTVFDASVNGAFTAFDAGTSAAFTSSVRASAMAGAMTTSGAAVVAMGMGPGHLDLDPASCDGSGSVATHMQWTDFDPDTECFDGMSLTLDFAQCKPATDQSLHGQMAMSFGGSTCDPTSVAVDFSDVAMTVPEGTVSGDFTMAMTGMAFVGDPVDFNVSAGTMTFDGRMKMVGSGFGTMDMDMDRVAFHFDDATASGDLNGTLTVRCGGKAFPMTFTTEAGALTVDAEGGVIGGHMTVTSHGTTHHVTFNSDDSIDITSSDGEPVHATVPVAADFCTL